MTTRQQRLAAINEAHYEWSQRWASEVPVPKRGEGSDVGLHHVDASDSVEANDDYARRTGA